MTIQEVCKAKRNALGMTIQDIAEASGIPPSTVNNFFTHASKAPLYLHGWANMRRPWRVAG